jgi:hypothetical protein
MTNGRSVLARDLAGKLATSVKSLGPLDYLLCTLITGPFAVGLQVLFFQLLSNASVGRGGGMFYLPSTPAEIVWALCLVSTSLPFIAFMVGGVWFTGLYMEVVIGLFPGFRQSDLTYPEPAFVALLMLGTLFQVLSWSAAVYAVRHRTFFLAEPVPGNNV